MKYARRSKWSKFFVVAFSIVLIPGCSWFSTEKQPTGEQEETKAPRVEVIHVTTKKDFDNYIQTKENVVADFSATWCPPCRRMHPINEELAKKYTDATFLVIDIDQARPLTKAYGVKGVPTFLFFKNGKEVEKHVGAMSKAVYDSKIKANFGL